MKRIWILGMSGFLGTHLAIRFRDRHRVIGTFHKHRPRVDRVTALHLEVTPQTDFDPWFQILQPDVVIYCLREPEPLHPTRRLFLEAKLPLFLAAKLKERGSDFVYFSNDSVFSGDNGPYSDDALCDTDDEAGALLAKAETSLAEMTNVTVLRLGRLIGISPEGRSNLWDVAWKGIEQSLQPDVHSYCTPGRVGEALEAQWELPEGAFPPRAPLNLALSGACSQIEFVRAVRGRFSHQLLGRPLPDITSIRTFELDSRKADTALKLKPISLHDWLEANASALASGSF